MQEVLLTQYREAIDTVEPELQVQSFFVSRSTLSAGASNGSSSSRVRPHEGSVCPCGDARGCTASWRAAGIRCGEAGFEEKMLLLMVMMMLLMMTMIAGGDDDVDDGDGDADVRFSYAKFVKNAGNHGKQLRLKISCTVPSQCGPAEELGCSRRTRDIMLCHGTQARFHKRKSLTLTP